MSDYSKIVGKSYVFDDNASIKIIHVKRRDDGMWVMLETDYGQGLPKRTVMPYHEFMDAYGHLFNNEE